MKNIKFFTIFFACVLFLTAAQAEDSSIQTCEPALLKQQAEQALAATSVDKVYFQFPEAGCLYRDRFYGDEYFVKRFSVERNPERSHQYNFLAETVNGKKPEIGASYATDGKSLLRMLELKPL